MKQPIALVLGSGGARGLAHIGVIEEFEKQGFEISSIAGTSMGALIGGLYAMDKLQDYKEWSLTLDKVEVFNLIDFTFSSQGLIKADRVIKKMKTFIADKNIEDLKIPFAAVATDITNEKEVVFTTGSVYEAVRASIAIPTVFTPVKKDNVLLVDGGVLNPTPANRVKRIGNDILVAVNVYADIPHTKEKKQTKKQLEVQSFYDKNIKKFKQKLNEIIPKSNKSKLGYFKLLNATTNAMIHQISKMTLDIYKPDILVDISRHSCHTFDFYKAEQLIEIGRFAAKESIEKYKKQLKYK
ncbi:MAG: patatin-like phospholipase family protein [Bacteroidales bacterium]|nr:patatin-like phospholipase family protein [Bacteroidales bacterium]